MKLTVDNFNYLGSCLEGFLFGELSVLQLRKPCLKRFKITLYQASILAYLPSTGICIILHPKKGPAKKQKIAFYALCLLYVLSAAVLALDTAGVWFTLFVSINELLF